MIRKTILFTVLLYFQFLFSQNCIFKEFGTNDGLPSLEVYDMYQVRNGVIWFATDRGLVSYNGYEFKKYGVQDGIPDNVVLDFYPQKDGTIYCATSNNRVFSFNEDFDKFTPYAYNSVVKKQIGNSYNITSFHTDKQGDLHFSCDRMLGRLIISKDGNILEKPKTNTNTVMPSAYLVLGENNNPFAYYSLDDVKVEPNFLKIETTFAKNNLTIVLPETNYIIYTTNQKFISIADDKGKLITIIDEQKKPIALKVIDKDHFFVGYHFGGGAIIDIKGTIVERFLEHKSVTDFLIDSEGGYWISTLNSGVFYCEEPTIKVFKNKIDASINSLTKNAINELFIGYDNGNVERVSTDKKSFIEYPSKEYYKAFVEYDNIQDELYVYSGKAFYKKSKEENFVNYSYDKYTLKLSEPTKEGVILSQLMQITVIENETIKKTKTSLRVHDACFWKDEIYLGTPLGVHILKNEKISSLETLYPLFKNRVDDIDFNENRNELYFATLGTGIIIYDKNTEEIRNITTEDGLLSNIIDELSFENENELWVCTNSGLNKIKFLSNGSYEVTGLKNSRGLLNEGISDVEVINDTVWIASRKGLIYAPKSLFDKKTERNSYYLQLKEFYVNDISVCKEKLENLSYKENRVEFLVEGVSFKESSELLYKYTLEGLDDKWYYTKNRQIIYPALPYGDYVLKVAATTSEKEENLMFLEVSIHIAAPFWKQVWFVILTILSTLVFIYLFFIYRILSYNRHMIRELLRLIIKKIKRKEKYFLFKEAGKDVRIKTNTILYVKSSGNYIEIVTENKYYTVRTRIGEFIELTPDPLEYIRIHRSYIIRIDKVAEKNSKEVLINGEKLPVSSSYLDELNNLIF